MSGSFDTERRLRDLTTIAEIAAKLAREMDTDELLQLVSFYATVLLEAERATLFLFESDGRTLVAKQAIGHPDPDNLVGRSFDPSLVVQLTSGEACRYQIVDAKQRRLFPFLDGELEGPALLCPIRGKQGMLGLLTVEHKVDGSPFESYDGEILERLATQAGIAIGHMQILADLDHTVGFGAEERDELKARNAELMLNLFPPTAVAELRRDGRVMPRRSEAVSILAASTPGLLQRVDTLPPHQLIDKFGRWLQRIESISARHGLEAIKTMGGTCLAVAGLSGARASHAKDAVAAGLEILAADANEDTEWQTQVGISSGSLVSGIGGQKRVSFDIWGRPVAAAQWLAATGAGHTVLVSEATQRLITPDYTCAEHGSVVVEGLGALAVYQVTR